MMSGLLNSIVLNAFTATALAVAVWVAGKTPVIRRRPGLRQGLWIVVLLKLVTPPLFELPILPGAFLAPPVPISHLKAVPLDNRLGKSSVPAGELRPVLPPLAAPNTTGIDWLWVAAFVNGLGTLTVLTFATGQIWRLRRALRGGATNDERLSRIGGMAADRMGLAVVPTVCVVAANVSPLLWVRRSGPLIVLPRRLVAQFTDEQLGCVMSHEIAHYLRRDHWTNLLSLMVAAACWWNPIAWWARSELRTAQEACCDALVISRAVASRRKYAETLLQALEFIQVEGPLLPPLASGFGGKSSTERRFEMIANTRVSHRLLWRHYAVLLAALAVLPCLLTFTEAQEVDMTGDAGGGSQAVSFAAKPVETDRRIYRVQDSDRGLVVLAFDKESKRLAWSSEIELAQPNQAVAGQRFLLHTGGGVVTIAVVEGDKSLKVQELNAESGKVASECQLVGPPHDRLREVKLKQLAQILIEFDRITAGGVKEKLSDEEFLRRVYLDLTGLVPTVEETREFLNDENKQKRDKLVDRLLERIHPKPGADIKEKLKELQGPRQEADSRIAEYERAFQRQLNVQRASSGAASLNDKVRQLQSRLKQQYPDGRSAEFQQEFLRGLKAINRAIERESDERPDVESRVEEYERAFQRQLNAQGGKDR